MRKIDLLRLPIAEPQPLPADGKAVNYVACFRLHQLNRQPVLCMDAFDATCTKLMHRSFLWKGDFISCTWDAGQKAWKWRQAMLPTLIDAYGWGRNAGPVWDADSQEAVKAFVPENHYDPERLFGSVLQYQEDIRADQLHAKHQRQLKNTRQAMAAVPEMPAGVDEWIDADLMLKSRYLMYQYTGRKRQAAYCTHCNSHVEVENLRHEKPARCPACGTEAKALAEGKISKYGFEDKISFCVIQRYKGTEIVARHFNACREYTHDAALHTLTFKDSYRESVRSIWHKKGFTVYSDDYEMGVYKHNYRNGFDWIPYVHAPYPPCRVYAPGLTDELRGTWAQYSGLDFFAKGRYLAWIDGYLTYWAKNPSMEYIVKGGLYRLAAELSDMVRSPYSGLRKLDEKTLRCHAGDLLRHGGGYYALLAFEALDKCNARYDAREVMRFMEKCSDYNRIADLMQYASLKKINDYLEKYKSRAARDLQDYWNMQAALGANMTEKKVLFPRNLQKAHDESIVEYNKRKDEILVHGFQMASRRMEKRFSFMAGGIMVVVPQTVDDLAKEGKALSHCVRTYAERVAKGETAILFIRKAEAPETPYFTMEVRDGRVVQLRGKNNCAPKEDVKQFEQAFCAHCHLMPRSA